MCALSQSYESKDELECISTCIARVLVIRLYPHVEYSHVCLYEDSIRRSTWSLNAAGGAEVAGGNLWMSLPEYTGSKLSEGAVEVALHSSEYVYVD